MEQIDSDFRIRLQHHHRLYPSGFLQEVVYACVGCVRWNWVISSIYNTITVCIHLDFFRRWCTAVLVVSDGIGLSAASTTPSPFVSIWISSGGGVLLVLVVSDGIGLSAASTTPSPFVSIWISSGGGVLLVLVVSDGIGLSRNIYNTITVCIHLDFFRRWCTACVGCVRWNWVISSIYNTITVCIHLDFFLTVSELDIII